MTQQENEMDLYMFSLKPDRKAALEVVRSLILETILDITETMKYRMPTYELDEVVCAFASQKHYMSLYMDTSLVERYKPEFKGLNIGKSCIRFKKIEDLPMDTIRKILMETVENQRKDRAVH